MSHTERRRDLGGGGIPGIAGPLRVLVVAATATHELTDRRESTRGRPRLAGRVLLDRAYNGGVICGNEATIEHMFEYTDTADKNVQTQYGTRARYCRSANAATSQPSTVSAITTSQCRNS